MVKRNWFELSPNWILFPDYILIFCVFHSGRVSSCWSSLFPSSFFLISMGFYFCFLVLSVCQSTFQYLFKLMQWLKLQNKSIRWHNSWNPASSTPVSCLFFLFLSWCSIFLSRQAAIHTLACSDKLGPRPSLVMANKEERRRKEKKGQSNGTKR